MRNITPIPEINPPISYLFVLIIIKTPITKKGNCQGHVILDILNSIMFSELRKNNIPKTITMKAPPTHCLLFNLFSIINLNLILYETKIILGSS